MSPSWFSSFQTPASGVSAKLKSLWKKDASATSKDFSEDIKDLLLEANFGPSFVESFFKKVGSQSFKALSFEDALKALLDALTVFLKPFMGSFARDKAKKPFVVMLVGVNGSGKTTTAGKLSALYKAEGAKVLFASADFFRAAAGAQASAWASNVGVDFHETDVHKDSASFVFDAMRVAKEHAYDVLLLDTAGRLHTQKNLMDELSKLERILKKHDQEAPHACFLVFDGTVGQNAAQQLALFKAHLPVNGLIVTKLDGTQKPGSLVPLLAESGIPLVGFGCGEGVSDLRLADAKALAHLLLGAKSSL